jgi:intracellular sulfur oxidation DsrE/DsrF family protein
MEILKISKLIAD